MTDIRQPQPWKPKTLKVLIVDPSAFSRTILGEVLRTMGVTSTVFAKTTTEAFNYFLNEVFDIVLIEWDMKPASGVEFSRSIRTMSDPFRQQVKIIMVSALTRKSDVIAARDAGVDEFVMKPVSPAALAARMKTVTVTPRPWVDHPVYVGPCRRRKNSADYYGTRRREDDRAAKEVHETEEELGSPFAGAIADLKATAEDPKMSERSRTRAVQACALSLKKLGLAHNDDQITRTAEALSLYTGSVGLNAPDAKVIEVAIAALTQLCMLPESFEDARIAVATSMEKAVAKKISQMKAASAA